MAPSLVGPPFELITMTHPSVNPKPLRAQILYPFHSFEMIRIIRVPVDREELRW